MICKIVTQILFLNHGKLLENKAKWRPTGYQTIRNNTDSTNNIISSKGSKHCW